MDTNFFSMDLHVHTPASRCYTGRNDDNTYLDILRRCKKVGLSIIAITDHNTVAGYKRFLRVKQELGAELVELQQKPGRDQNLKEIVRLKKALSLFDDVFIIPGVEFETKYNVHILILFNPSTPIKEIDDFLIRGGYEANIQGVEEPSILAKWDVIDLFGTAETFDCLIIDAHTDSNKGLFNLEKGRYRAKCFKSPQLAGVCYKSEKQRSNIERLLNESLEYQRDSPLAFLKASDAHSVKDIGRLMSWVRVDKLDFANVKDAFANPVERISVEPPTFRDILRKLLAREDCYVLENIKDDNKLFYQQLICAINNSNGGYCLIGIDERKRMIGIDVTGDLKDSAVIKEHFEPIIRPLNEIVGRPEIGFNVYPIQESKVIVSLNVKSIGRLASIKNDDRVYCIKGKQPSALNAKEVQSLIEDRQARVISDRIEKSVSCVKEQCDLLIDTIEFLSIVRKFEEKSTLLSNLITKVREIESLRPSEKGQTGLLRSYKDCPNGHSKGNIIIIEEELSPRLKDAYLRFSLPKHYLRGATIEGREEATYVFPGGAAFYSDRERKVFSTKGYDGIFFRPNPARALNNKFLVAFLKSSFWIWYSIFKLEDWDLYKPEVFRKCRIPDIKKDNDEDRSRIGFIEKRFDEILQLENAFLRTNYRNRTELEKAIEKHNRLIDKPAYVIDKLIYEIIGINESHIEKIETFLRKNAIYLPKKQA
jgi:hypothetical protein